MKRDESLTAVILEDKSLDIDELARACAVEPQWIIERVETGILGDGSTYTKHWRFSSDDLRRARRLRQLERDFDAAPELAALCADLIEEVERLRRLLDRNSTR